MIETAQRAWILAQAHQPIEFSIPPPNELPSLKNVGSSADAVKALVLIGVNAIFAIAATAAVAGVIYGGFLMMSGGDKGVKGRKALVVSLGGLGVASLAYAAVKLAVGVDLVSPQIG